MIRLSVSLCRTIFFQWRVASYFTLHVAIQRDRKRNERKQKKTQHVHFAWSLPWIVAWTQRLVWSPKISAPCPAQTFVSSVFFLLFFSWTVCSQLSESTVTSTLWWARYPVAHTLTSKRKRRVVYRGQMDDFLPPHFAHLHINFKYSFLFFKQQQKFSKSTFFFSSKLLLTILQPGAKSASRAKNQPLYYNSMSFFITIINIISIFFYSFLQ